MNKKLLFSAILVLFTTSRKARYIWYPIGDLNPCYRRERAAICSKQMPYKLETITFKDEQRIEQKSKQNKIIKIS